MRNRMTFEEKYWANQNQTVVEETPIQIDIEDTVVPPSLEEDANQWSPLPPGVENASNIDNLDEYIRKAQELAAQEKKEEKEETPIILTQSKPLKEATLEWMRAMYNDMTVKELKEEYVAKWGTRDIEHNNNKKNLINLILELVENGAQEKETEWSDWTENG